MAKLSKLIEKPRRETFMMLLESKVILKFDIIGKIRNRKQNKLLHTTNLKVRTYRNFRPLVIRTKFYSVYYGSNCINAQLYFFTRAKKED